MKTSLPAQTPLVLFQFVLFSHNFLSDYLHSIKLNQEYRGTYQVHQAFQRKEEWAERAREEGISPIPLGKTGNQPKSGYLRILIQLSCKVHFK